MGTTPELRRGGAERERGDGGEIYFGNAVGRGGRAVSPTCDKLWESCCAQGSQTRVLRAVLAKHAHCTQRCIVLLASESCGPGWLSICTPSTSALASGGTSRASL
jgi:hypothetical protein